MLPCFNFSLTGFSLFTIKATSLLFNFKNKQAGERKPADTAFSISDVKKCEGCVLVYTRFTVVYNVNVVQNAAHSDMYKGPFGSFL